MADQGTNEERFFRLERWVTILQEFRHKGSSRKLAAALNCGRPTVMNKFHQLEEYGLAEIVGCRHEICDGNGRQPWNLTRIPIYGLTWRGLALLRIMLEGQRDNGREK